MYTACGIELLRVVYLSICFATYEIHHSLRTLAHSESVACVNLNISGNEELLIVHTKHKNKKHKIFYGAPPGEQSKTTECCFYEAKSTKQGAEEASVSSDTQRLCDLTGTRTLDPLYTACGIERLRVVYLSICFATYEIHHTLRTLAHSESVACLFGT